MASPTSRTLDALRKMDYRAQVVERWCMHTKRRIDLFGFIDIVAVKDNTILAVQATSTNNQSVRVQKIFTERRDDAIAWLRAGGRIQVWGWKKYVKPVDGKWWRPTITEITSIELEGS